MSRFCFLDPEVDPDLAHHARNSDRETGLPVVARIHGGAVVAGSFRGDLDQLMEAVRLGGEPAKPERWNGSRALRLTPARLSNGGPPSELPTLIFSVGDIQQLYAPGLAAAAAS